MQPLKKRSGALRARLIPAVLSALAVVVPASGAQSPCIDADSLLEMLAIPDSRPNLLFTGAIGAFVPDAALYKGKTPVKETNQLYIVMRRGDTEIDRRPCTASTTEAVFTWVKTFGRPLSAPIAEAGDYTITMQLDETAITEVAFSVQLKTSDDPFNPSTSAIIEADLLHWGRLTVNRSGRNGEVEFEFRLRNGEFGLGDTSDVVLTIEQEGRTIYDVGTANAMSRSRKNGWSSYSNRVYFSTAQGGGPVHADEFHKRDGDYSVVMTAEGKRLREFPFTVRGGKLVPHARSSFDHKPAPEYLLSRVPLDRSRGMIDVTWIEPTAPSAAAAAAPIVAASSTSTAKWAPTSPVPARAAEVVVTEVGARVDAHLAAGDGIIAYGTGAVRGVAYFDTETREERSFEGGTDATSGLFFVCGKKLVLFQGRQVVVHDTATGQNHAIPESEVWLAKNAGKYLKGRVADASGMLVAVLCDPSKTSDRRSVKVIDLSGPVPSVIALGYPDVEPNHLATVTVDAANGQVVVGSERANAIYVASVAPDAPFQTWSLAAHDGYSSDCAPIVQDGVAWVFDDTGNRKLRTVDLASGTVKTIAPLGKSLRWFDVSGDVVAMASTTSKGSAYDILVGRGGAKPASLEGSGASVGAGLLGYGQRVAISDEGLVFTSGGGDGGIGSGEYLFVSSGSSWSPVTSGGEPLKAVDVIHGDHIVAFKTGKARDARLGFVLLGKGTAPSQLGL